MGLFAKWHRRAQERQDDARSQAESAARAEGRPEDAVKAAGDQAARKKRRRMLSGGGS